MQRKTLGDIGNHCGNLGPPSNIEQSGDNSGTIRCDGSFLLRSSLQEEMQIEELNPEPMCCTQGPMFTAGSGPRGSIDIRLGFD